MKFIICILLSINSLLACQIDPKFAQHELTIETLNYLYKKYYFSVNEIKTISIKNFKMEYSPERNSGIDCPDKFQAEVYTEYKDGERFPSFSSIVKKNKNEIIIQETRTCCKGK